MTAHTYRTVDVPVAGGDLHVAIWDPQKEPDPQDPRPQALLVHGVTSSHRAWPFVVDELPDARLIAPDLRGRGRSNDVQGPAGMRAHAADLAAVLDHLGIDQIVVVGHSMGAFVAVTFAHLYPERVSRLVLVDGGVPLDVPAGMDPDALVSHILGPTAARLSLRFANVDEYLDFWRDHPAFRDDWTPELQEYIAYDLSPADGGFRPATSYQTTVDDTIDMNTGTTLTDAITALAHPTVLITVPRGLQNEEPGLYAPEYLERALAQLPEIEHHRFDGLNHYTIVLSEQGARVVAPFIRADDASRDHQAESSTRRA